MPEVLPYGDNRAQKILELRLMEAGAFTCVKVLKKCTEITGQISKNNSANSPTDT